MTGPADPPAAHPAFIQYPAQAAFGRTLPKNKLYAHSQAGARLKGLFVQQVEQIVWQYKLAPETINLSARPGVPEIQVFAIHLKARELHVDGLRAIDQAVQFPIVFELVHAGHTQVVACHKRPSAVDANRWLLSDYFATAWLPPATPRAAMPVVLHLGGLYEQVLRALLPLPARPHEALVDQVARLGDIAAKQRDVDKAAAQLARTTQFNRKLAVNAGLRQLQAELDALRGPPRA